MSTIRTFTILDAQVRGVEVDGERWYFGQDVCAMLGVKDYRQALAALAADERTTMKAETAKGPHDRVFVNEAGMFRLIMAGRKPAARRFQDWVLRDLLKGTSRALLEKFSDKEGRA